MGVAERHLGASRSAPRSAALRFEIAALHIVAVTMNKETAVNALAVVGGVTLSIGAYVAGRRLLEYRKDTRWKEELGEFADRANWRCSGGTASAGGHSTSPTRHRRAARAAGCDVGSCK